MPNLSLSLSIVTLIYCLSLFDGWHALFRDSDTGWHIRTGESIITTHSLPTTDPYSFTRGGQSWLDWEWGADVVTAIAYRSAGEAGVAALFAIAIAACTGLWIALHFAIGGDLLMACLMAAPMLSTVNMHWLARPHVFGWLLLLGCLLALERRASPVIFLALGIVWANVHASFFLGPLIALLYLAGELAATLIWNGQERYNWRGRAITLAALTAGTFVNPYGWNLHRHVLAYLSDSELLARIGEFQSFNFHAAGAGQVMLAFAIACIGAVVALTERRFHHFLVSALFLCIGLRSARGLPLVALAALPLANGAITEALRRARGLAPVLRVRLNNALDYSERLRVIDRRLGGWALVPVVLAVLFAVTRTAQAGFPEDQFPVKASAVVSQLPADARLLAPDKFGGYLIYRFGGARKVYFDGRSDFYGSQFMKDYLHLLEARPGWREQVAQAGFTHALLPNNYSLIPALEQAGWQKSYQDATATMLTAPGH